MDNLYNLYIHLVGAGRMLQQLISAGIASTVIRIAAQLSHSCYQTVLC